MFQLLKETELVGGQVGHGGTVVAALGRTEGEFEVHQRSFDAGAGWAEDGIRVDVEARIEVAVIFVIPKNIVAAYVVVESLNLFGDIVLGARIFDAEF